MPNNRSQKNMLIYCMLKPWEPISLKKLHNVLSVDLYKEIGDINESKAIVSLLLQEYLLVSMTDILIGSQVMLSQKEVVKIQKALERLKKHEPIQYVLGKAHFFGKEYIVNNNALIPRPETEELVKLIIEENNNSSYAYMGFLLPRGRGEAKSVPFSQKLRKSCNDKHNLSILDIGTGSGCIAIALYNELFNKCYKNIKVDAIDICRGALDVAKANATNLKADIKFHNIDIMDEYAVNEFVKEQKWDIIVSNPPYVRDSEKAKMSPNVLLYEPSKALFVPDLDPLIFYNRISDICTKNLNFLGSAYLEINEALADRVAEIFNNKGFNNTIIKKDINDKDRFIIAKT